MDVCIVVFPETKVAAVEHFGPPDLEHETAKKLIAWKIERRLLDPLRRRSYGVHYTDPYRTRRANIMSISAAPSMAMSGPTPRRHR